MQQAAKHDPNARRILTEPYSINPPGERQGPDLASSNALRSEELADGWTAPFLMAYMNERIVRRSNALLDFEYGRDFRYHERSRLGRGPAGLAKAAIMAAGTALWPAVARVDPLRKLLEATVLPDPGEGPSDEAIEKGVFEMRFFGTFDDSSDRVVARFAGEGDPGYGITITTLVECALCLAIDRERLPDRYGVLTPATAMGSLLIERLRNAGLTLELCD